MRDLWNNNLSCYVDHGYNLPILTIAAIVLICPLLFYVVGRMLCRQKGPTLMPRKLINLIHCFLIASESFREANEFEESFARRPRRGNGIDKSS